MAPVIRALDADQRFDPFVVVTAQHRQILDQVLDLFDIVPDADLALQQHGQTLTDVTTRGLAGLSTVLAEGAPDAVLVQGDTTTTFVGGLAAFYHGVPVVHLEAGLRTGNRQSPFPEEINRRLTTVLTDLHLAPTARSRANLLNEAVPADHIVVTGNTVIDALHWTVGRRLPYTDPALQDLDDDPRRVLLVTAHRRESWGAGMVAIAEGLRRITEAHSDLLVVFPIHPNPVVRKEILPVLKDHRNVRIVEPLPYGEFARLMERSWVVLTDSGGVQEEAPSLGKPVLVMRDTTERPEAVDAGTARLVGTDALTLFTAVDRLFTDSTEYSRMANAVNPYGDGRAAERALAAMAKLLSGHDLPVDEFSPNSRR